MNFKDISYKEKLEFKKISQKYGLSLLILFGSQVNNMASDKSDVDIAVWFDKKGKIEEDIEEAVFSDFINLLKRDRIDLIILNYADPLLQFEVASKGMMLYEKRKGEFNRFQVFAMKRNDDGKKFYTLNKVYLENFLKGKRSDVKRECHPPKISSYS